MVVRVIKTESDYEAAMQRIDKLMDARRGTARGDELELLTTLVELYEQESFPIGLPSPQDAIRFRMEQRGLRRQDLVRYIGSPGRVSEVLSGKRSLSIRMVRSLIQGLGIPAEVLLQTPRKRTPRATATGTRRLRRALSGAPLRPLGLSRAIRRP